MGINDFIDLFKNKNLEEIKFFMVKKGWNFKEELYIKEKKNIHVFSFFNHIITFSTILDINITENEKKEKIIKLAAECLYEDFKYNYSSL